MARQTGSMGWGLRVLALGAVAFGLLTLKEGGAVLFVDSAGRQAAGQYVPFVLWFNFLAGFAYVAAGIGLWLRRPWAARLAVAIALASVLVLMAFLLFVMGGGAHEKRTLVAMPLRALIWSGIAWWAWRQLVAVRRAA